MFHRIYHILGKRPEWDYSADRLPAFMNQKASVEAGKLLPALKANIDKFEGEAPQLDDIATMIFDYKP